MKRTKEKGDAAYYENISGAAPPSGILTTPTTPSISTFSPLLTDVSEKEQESLLFNAEINLATCAKDEESSHGDSGPTRYFTISEIADSSSSSRTAVKESFNLTPSSESPNELSVTCLKNAAPIRIEDLLLPASEVADSQTSAKQAPGQAETTETIYKKREICSVERRRSVNCLDKSESQSTCSVTRQLEYKKLYWSLPARRTEALLYSSGLEIGSVLGNIVIKYARDRAEKVPRAQFEKELAHLQAVYKIVSNTTPRLWQLRCTLFKKWEPVVLKIGDLTSIQISRSGETKEYRLWCASVMPYRNSFTRKVRVGTKTLLAFSVCLSDGKVLTFGTEAIGVAMSWMDAIELVGDPRDNPIWYWMNFDGVLCGETVNNERSNLNR